MHGEPPATAAMREKKNKRPRVMRGARCPVREQLDYRFSLDAEGATVLFQ
jgi:hypothetical protein